MAPVSSVATAAKGIHRITKMGFCYVVTVMSRCCRTEAMTLVRLALSGYTHDMGKASLAPKEERTMKNPKSVRYWLKGAIAFDFITKGEALSIWQMLKSQDFDKDVFDHLPHTGRVLATLMIMGEIKGACRIFKDRMPFYETEGLYSYTIPQTNQLICLRGYDEYIEHKIAVKEGLK